MDFNLLVLSHVHIHVFYVLGVILHWRLTQYASMIIIDILSPFSNVLCKFSSALSFWDLLPFTFTFLSLLSKYLVSKMKAIRRLNVLALDNVTSTHLHATGSCIINKTSWRLIHTDVFITIIKTFNFFSSIFRYVEHNILL